MRVAPLTLLLVYCAFVSLGLPDAVTGVAWPTMRSDFRLPVSYLGLALLGVGSGYAASGLAAGTLTRRLGIGGLLSISCLLVCVAMAGMALSQDWRGLVTWPIVWGLGSGGIDAALNHYAAEHFPARHMNWLHACYSFGAAIGPLQMTFAIVWLGSWRLGYTLVAVAMAIMMAAFILTRRHWDDAATLASSNDLGVPDRGERSADTTTHTPSIRTDVEGVAPISLSLRQALSVGLVWWQAATFFFYTGLEALIGQWSTTLMTESRGTSAWAAGWWVGGYFLSIAIGRVLAGVMTERIGVARWLGGSLWLVILSTTLLQLPLGGTIGGITLVMLGIGLAPVFPCMMTQTPARLGRELTRHAIGIQVAAATMGAVTIPSFVGVLIPELGMEVIAHAALLLAIAVMLLSKRFP